MNTSQPFIISDATGVPREQQFHSNESPALIFALYAGIALSHLLNSGVSYRSQGGLKTKVRTHTCFHRLILTKSTALPYHAVAGIIEVLLLYSGARCSIFSVAACLIHSITGLLLVKNLRKGYSTITRPSYQAGCVLRPIGICLAYLSQNRSHYHDALVPIHAFVYTRAFFFLLGTIGPTTDFSKNVNSKYIYLTAIIGGALIAVGHCHNVWATPLYLLILHAIGKVNFWTKTQVDYHKKARSSIPQFIQILCSRGFCALSVRREAMQIDVNDGPKIGDLPADSVGHVWAKSAARIEQ